MTTTEVEMHPFKTKQASGMAVIQLLNFGFQFSQSSGNVPMLFDVPLAKNRRKLKLLMADETW